MKIVNAYLYTKLNTFLLAKWAKNQQLNKV